MTRKILTLVAVLLVFPPSAFPNQQTKRSATERRQGVKVPVVIWAEPHDIRTRDVLHGSGGKLGQPQGPFKFIKEDLDGSNPKFVVVDSRGVQWKVKLGDEAQPETAATRLLWAVGYFSDANYFRRQIRVAGMRKLSRGQKYVSAGGNVHGARLERMDKTLKKVDAWSWFHNPFLGTRQFNGLRVMMALMNNWDLKESNNAIYDVRGKEQRYIVSDLGACFGRTGSGWTRSRGNLEDYLESEFIEDTTPKTVDLVLHSRPPIIYAVAFPYYRERTRMGKVAEDIPRAHAKWIGQWLARLSRGQLAAVFEGAGYAPNEVDAYVRKLRSRIGELNEL